MFLGALGAVALLGFLSLAVILAQVVALVLLGFAPVALVIGIFPGAGTTFFRGWLAKLATAVFIKALYSLVIAIVVAVSAALTAATDSLGFLFAFGLQTIFFWAIFLYRKQITARLVAATTGAHHDGERLPRMTVVQRGAASPRDRSPRCSPSRPPPRGRGRQQESALAGGAHTVDGPARAAARGHDPTTGTRASTPAHGARGRHRSASAPNGRAAIGARPPNPRAQGRRRPAPAPLPANGGAAMTRPADARAAPGAWARPSTAAATPPTGRERGARRRRANRTRT